MRGLLRPMRLIWIFGFILLTGTVAGAGWILNNSNGNDDTNDKKSSVSVPFDGKGIVAIGHVDVKPGITRLYPLKFGRVAWVEKEGVEVKQGAELLRIDDWVALTDLDKAKLALDDAKLQLKEAQRLTEKHELEIKGQKSAIDAYQAEKRVAQEEIAKAQDLQKKGFGNLYDPKIADEKIKKMDALIEVEKTKLALLEKFGPAEKIQRAELDVKSKEKLVEQAEKSLKEYKVLAPTDGTVLRVYTSPGESLGANPKQPALEFCPKLPRIIRAEVQQEWADSVKLGQDAIIEDDSSSGYQWKGKVVFISDWYTHRRSIIQEPFQFNDVRTLECIIEITEQPGQHPLRIGQRMRVMINQGGP